MTGEHISEFINNLSKVLNEPSLLKDDLIPSILYNKIKNSFSEISWTSIPNWDSFEIGEQEWGIDEFLSLVQFKKGDELQILTDCTFQSDEVIVFSDSDYSSFEERYSNRFGEEFFQPLDYVIIKNNKHVVLLHHEGLVAYM